MKKLDLPNTTLFPFRRVSILVIAVKLASPAQTASGIKQRAERTPEGAAYTSNRMSSSSSPSLSSTCDKELHIAFKIKRCAQKLTLSRETRASNLYSGSALSPVASICQRVRSYAFKSANDNDSTLAVSSPPPSAGTTLAASAISRSVCVSVVALWVF